MQTYSFYDDGISEAMLYFVDQPEEYGIFLNAQLEGDISIAQYCFDHFQRFKAFCEERFGFSVYKPRN